MAPDSRHVIARHRVRLVVVYSVGYVRHRRSVARDSLDEPFLVPHVDPAWGTVSMELLSVGGALLTVGPLLVFAHGFVVAVDSILWWLGTAIGIVTNLMFLARALVKQGGTPVPPWGLAVVSPMVSATAGAVLLLHFKNPALQFVVLTLSFACFVIALATGAVIFTVTYLTHVRVSALPVSIAISSWIPLGVVGQSAAAAVAIAVAARLFLQPEAEPLAHATAAVYGLAMSLIAVPVVALAIHLTVKGFRARMPFNPGWWALTFPIGTLALGGHLLEGLLCKATFPSWFMADVSRSLAPIAGFAGNASLLALCCTWTFCAMASMKAVASVHTQR